MLGVAPSKGVKRRGVLQGAAALGVGAIGSVVQPGEAQAFLPLLLRGLALGGARAGVTATRAAVAGRAYVRPAATQATSNGRLVRSAFSAGRWLYSNDNRDSRHFGYESTDQYNWEVQRYPEMFASVPLQFCVENRTGYDQWVPSSNVWLSFNDGRVWQAYSVPDFRAVPGTRGYWFFLNGVSTGWSYSAIAALPFGDGWSNTIYG